MSIRANNNQLNSKLWRVCTRYFRVLISLNFLLSLCLLFFAASLLLVSPSAILPTLLYAKLIGYIVSITLERLFYSDRRVFFYNLGLSYRRIFSMLFLFDGMLFLTLLVVWIYLVN